MANPQPTDAHLRIAHSIHEQVMVSDFSKRQRKILDLILRLSWGCGKKDAIIPRQNDFEIIGVHESDIRDELNHLINCKVIFVAGEHYQFNKDFEQWRVTLARKYTPERLGKLLSLNLNNLGKTPSDILVKHQESTLQNTKNSTPNLALPKERIKKYIKKEGDDTINIGVFKIDKYWYNHFCEELLSDGFNSESVKNEIERFNDYWSDSQRNIKSPKLALRNWFEKAKEIRNKKVTKELPDSKRLQEEWGK